MEHQVISVSVIIPAFNRANIIEKSISSVLNQTWQNFELIIVDDCSADIEQLKEVLKRYNDQRIILLEHQSNQNGAAARNTGIAKASGEFIAFLDSDDIWHPTKLAEQIQHIEQMCEKSILYCRLRSYNSSTPHQYNLIPNHGYNNKDSLGEYLFCQNGVMQTSSLFMYTAFAKQLKFNPALRRHQDYDFLLRAENQGANFVYIDQLLVDYIWLDSDSLSKKMITVERSLHWLDEYQQFLTTNARFGFICKEVCANAIRHRKLKLLLSYVSNHFSFRYISKIFISILKIFTQLAIAKLKRSYAKKVR